MDASEALFDPVRVPRQVVVDEQVRVAVQVHALTGGVSGDEEHALLVLLECFLRLLPILTAGAAVDGDDSVVPAKVLGQAGYKVVEGVLVLGEDDDLPPCPGVVTHLVGVIEGVTQRVPLRIGRGCLDGGGPDDEPVKDRDLGFQFLRGAGVRGPGDRAVFEGFAFLVCQVLQVVPVGHVHVVSDSG